MKEVQPQGLQKYRGREERNREEVKILVLHRKEPLFILRDKIKLLHKMGVGGLAELRGINEQGDRTDMVFEKIKPICRYFLSNASDTFLDCLRYHIED